MHSLLQKQVIESYICSSHFRSMSYSQRLVTHAQCMTLSLFTDASTRGELTDTQPMNDKIMFKIIGRSISLQTKCMDSGLRPNLYVQNYALMYYFVNFFKRKTRHHFFGPLNAYAYTNEDDTRAFINLRMNVIGVRPYANVDDDNNIIPSNAIRMKAEDYDNDKFIKMRYMIYKYVWQNIDDENIVKQERLNKEPFAHYLSDLHDDLCERKIILNGGSLNPVHVTERIVRQKVAGNKLTERVRDVEYTFNENVPRVDWDHPALTLSSLLNNRIAFPIDLVSVSEPIDTDA